MATSMMPASVCRIAACASRFYGVVKCNPTRPFFVSAAFFAFRLPAACLRSSQQGESEGVYTKNHKAHHSRSRDLLIPCHWLPTPPIPAHFAANSGIALGSMIYDFMPAEFVSAMASDGNLLAVPIAAIIGVPLSIRAGAVIPLSAAVAAKGTSLDTVLALNIGSAGASLTKVILLKSIFENQMIAAFLAVIIGMAVGAGYLYGFIF